MLEKEKGQGVHPERNFVTVEYLNKELDTLAERFGEELGKVLAYNKKNQRREVLNLTLLNMFKKEMWVHRIILSIVTGFALGVFVTSIF